jgi:hypothetical protein
MADSGRVSPAFNGAPKTPEPFPSFDDLRKINRRAKDIAHYASLLLNWAHGKAPVEPGYLRNPNSLVDYLLEAFRGLRVMPDSIYDLSPDAVQQFAGVTKGSFHAVAWAIGVTILDLAAKSLGGLLFIGVDPETLLSRASITGLGILPDFVTVDLRTTNFREQLKAVPHLDRFDEDMLAELLDKEADQTQARWREQSKARPDGKNAPDRSGEAPAPAVLSKTQMTVLVRMIEKAPQLCTFDDLEHGTNAEECLSHHLSRGTVNSAVKYLIEVGYAERPAGPRKGVTATKSGKSAVGRKSQTDP